MSFVERLQAFERRLQANMHNIFCPTHLCLGQEQVPAELHKWLKPSDWLFSPHRSHGYYLAKGGSEEKLYNEILGLPTGLNGGFSGSQGFSDPSINFHCSAIVGGLVGVATGTAYALKMDGSDSIVVCCMGDGGTEQGVFWEALNWAALHKLPIAYICENNGKSVDATLDERQATSLTGRVKAFGLFAADGVREAVTSARHGIPAFYEAHVKLQCDHLNMSALVPKVYA